MDRHTTSTLIKGRADAFAVAEVLEFVRAEVCGLRDKLPSVPYDLPVDSLTLRLYEDTYTWQVVAPVRPWSEKLSPRDCRSAPEKETIDAMFDRVIWQTTSLLLSLELTEVEEIEPIKSRTYLHEWR